jgi:hypothetical protein
VGPGGRSLHGSWQRWARASLMATVAGRITVRMTGCPALPRAAGCVRRKRPRTIYLHRGLRRSRSVLLHELGHLFDLRAEGCSFCARCDRIVSIARYSNYHYRPTRRQHAKICALIMKAAGDRNGRPRRHRRRR